MLLWTNVIPHIKDTSMVSGVTANAYLDSDATNPLLTKGQTDGRPRYLYGCLLIQSSDTIAVHVIRFDNPDTTYPGVKGVLTPVPRFYVSNNILASPSSPVLNFYTNIAFSFSEYHTSVMLWMLS